MLSLRRTFLPQNGSVRQNKDLRKLSMTDGVLVLFGSPMRDVLVSKVAASLLQLLPH